MSKPSTGPLKGPVSPVTNKVTSPTTPKAGLVSSKSGVGTSAPIKTGNLHKWEDDEKSWTTRYFSLFWDRLTWSKNQTDTVPIGNLALSTDAKVQIETVDGITRVTIIPPGGGNCVVKANDDSFAIAKGWASAINMQIVKLKQQKFTTLPAKTPLTAASFQTTNPSSPPVSSTPATPSPSLQSQVPVSHFFADDDDDEDSGDEDKEKDKGENSGPVTLHRGSILRSGNLLKLGEKVKNWKSRWFVMYSDKIVYFKSQKDQTGGKKPAGTIGIQHTTTVKVEFCDGQTEPALCITPGLGDRTYFLVAPKIDDRYLWKKDLESAIAQQRKRQAAEGTTHSRPGSLKEGVLLKQGDVVKNWKKRYFVLFKNELQYFKARDAPKPAGVIPLTVTCTVEETEPADSSSPPHTFALASSQGSRKFIIAALDAFDRADWISSILLEKQVNPGPYEGIHRFQGVKKTSLLQSLTQDVEVDFNKDVVRIFQVAKRDVTRGDNEDDFDVDVGMNNSSSGSGSSNSGSSSSSSGKPASGVSSTVGVVTSAGAGPEDGASTGKVKRSKRVQTIPVRQLARVGKSISNRLRLQIDVRAQNEKPFLIDFISSTVRQRCYLAILRLKHRYHSHLKNNKLKPTSTSHGKRSSGSVNSTGSSTPTSLSSSNKSLFPSSSSSHPSSTPPSTSSLSHTPSPPSSSSSSELSEEGPVLDDDDLDSTTTRRTVRYVWTCLVCLNDTSSLQCERCGAARPAHEKGKIIRTELPPPPISEEDEKEVKDYSAHQELTFFVGTLNMGRKPPPDRPLTWIPLDRDVYAIGVQECRYPPRPPYTNCEADWLHSVLRRVGPKYAVAKVHTMWEIRMAILVRRELLDWVTGIEAAYVKTGVANVAGNKGGVGICMNIFDLSVGFICCHLAAGPKKIKSRNQNARDIFHNLTIGSKLLDPLHAFDLTFVFGDFNYRIVSATREQIVEWCASKNWKALSEADQLIPQVASGNVFCGTHEGKILWPPSYRYDEESEEWSKKKLKNLPSYCDRVLWHAASGLQVDQLDYTLNSHVYGSDHRPVTTNLKVKVWKPILEPLPHSSSSSSSSSSSESSSSDSAGSAVLAEVQVTISHLELSILPSSAKEIKALEGGIRVDVTGEYISSPKQEEFLILAGGDGSPILPSSLPSLSSIVPPSQTPEDEDDPDDDDDNEELGLPSSSSSDVGTSPSKLPVSPSSLPSSRSDTSSASSEWSEWDPVQRQTTVPASPSYAQAISASPSFKGKDTKVGEKGDNFARFIVPKAVTFSLGKLYHHEVERISLTLITRLAAGVVYAQGPRVGYGLIPLRDIQETVIIEGDLSLAGVKVGLYKLNLLVSLSYEKPIESLSTSTSGNRVGGPLSPSPSTLGPRHSGKLLGTSR